MPMVNDSGGVNSAISSQTTVKRGGRITHYLTIQRRLLGGGNKTGLIILKVPTLDRGKVTL